MEVQRPKWVISCECPRDFLLPPLNSGEIMQAVRCYSTQIKLRDRVLRAVKKSKVLVVLWKLVTKRFCSLRCSAASSRN